MTCVAFFSLARYDLDNFAILSEMAWSPQGLQGVLVTTNVHTNHIDQIFLQNSEAGQVFAIECFDLLSLSLFLSRSSFFLRLGSNIGFEP